MDAHSSNGIDRPVPPVLASLRNRVFLMADLVVWLVLPVVALSLRLDSLGEIGAYATPLLAFAAVAICVKFVVLRLFGIYRRYWRYASVQELTLIAAAVLVAGVVAAALYFLAVAPFLAADPALPRSVPIVDMLLTVLYVGGSRFVIRTSEDLLARRHSWGVREHLLIVGAGQAGTMIARELRANPQLEMEPVGFLDDDPQKHGKTIWGLRVIGGRDRIADSVRDYRVTTVIIAMPTAPGSVIREIRDACEALNVRAKTVPGVFEILSGRVAITQLRDVQIEDLLRRPPVQTDQRAVGEFLRGATVLVTGAGGSIGSEICRQAARFGADELILLGHGENSVFDVNNELAAKYPKTHAVPVIADIRNTARIRKVFDKYRPGVVFHAAAHKHVPLMEKNPEEAVTNNILGTLNVLTAAEAAGVGRFVMISTDKAVRPANTMGATKLLAETIVHDAAVRTGRCFVTVRFGNVLASRGSVIPKFRQQIRAGGPLTVTHPDMTRYFMTIPEAVELVLQAAALGRGGETFVLDMGDPVRIADLAKDLIKLSGLEVGKDIDLIYTGLRPGEKMSEELFNGGERVVKTAHDKVYALRNGDPGSVENARIRELIAAAQREDGLRVTTLLGELAAGFDAAQPPAASTSRPALGA